MFTHLNKVANQCSNSKKRQIKHKNSYKIFTEYLQNRTQQQTDS